MIEPEDTEEEELLKWWGNRKMNFSYLNDFHSWLQISSVIKQHYYLLLYHHCKNTFFAHLTTKQFVSIHNSDKLKKFSIFLINLVKFLLFDLALLSCANKSLWTSSGVCSHVETSQWEMFCCRYVLTAWDTSEREPVNITREVGQDWKSMLWKLTYFLKKKKSLEQQTRILVLFRSTPRVLN